MPLLVGVVTVVFGCCLVALAAVGGALGLRTGNESFSLKFAPVSEAKTNTANKQTNPKQ